MKKSVATTAGGPSSAVDCAVKVAVRERPRMPSDSTRASIVGSRSSLISGTGAADDDEPDQRTVIERAGALEDNIIVVGDRPFVFDAVLGPAVGQQQLYEQLVQPLVDRLLGGFFCTVLAYGQTGTGKSYTMGLHTEAFADDQGGVVPRTLRDIFGRVHASNASGSTEATLAISFIEIYNEKVIDLLLADHQHNDENAATAANGSFGGPPPPPTKSHQARGQPATRRPVRTAAEALRVLADGNRQRHVRPTKMNAQSSRSHAICTVHATVRAANRHTVSAMHLVDLAGSEGVRRTGAQGAALAEGVHINQGLLSIGKVLQALSTGQRVVPYRDSVLSSVLQDSLNGNAYLTLLACISPLAADLSETLSTLRFAHGAKALRLTPQVNAIVADIKRTRTPAKLPKTPNKHLLPAAAEVAAAAAASTPASPCRRPGKVQRTPLLARKSLFAHSTAVRAVGGAAGRRAFGTPGRTQLNKTVSGTMQQRRQQQQQQQRQRTTTAASNDTLRLCDESEMFLDVSTSTVFEQAATPAAVGPRVAALSAAAVAAAPVPASFSPLVRRCVQEVEQSLGQQIRALMQSFAADNTLQPMPCAVPMTPLAAEATIGAGRTAGDDDVDADVHGGPSVSGGVAEQTVVARTVGRRSSGGARRSKRISRSAEADDMAGRTMHNISWNTLTRGLRQIVRDELTSMQANTFAAASHTDVDTTATAQHMSAAPPPQTPPTSPSSRTPPQFVVCDSTTPPFKMPIVTQTKAKNVRRSSRRTLATTTTGAQPFEPTADCRRSARLSVRRRQTIDELTTQPPAPPQPLPPKRRRLTVSGKQTAATAIRQLAAVDASPSQKRQQHGDFVLGLFNAGSLRELQILPQIGPKLAYQIIMHRSSNGKLRSLAEMAALPIWRGKSWERFQTLNCLN